MGKAKLYKINNNSNVNSFILDIVVYAVVLFIASIIFNNLYIENFLYAIVAALIMTLLNSTVKPILVFLTLPINIITFGITYPIVNMIVLKICDLLMGKYFIIFNFWGMFFIAIFISILKILFDKMIFNKTGGR